jgi:histidinol-phosphate aminotransferase
MPVFIPEYIKKLEPYKPGNKLKESPTERKAVSDFINLASNENPLGASPLAIEALKQSAKFLAIYPDVGSTELVDFLSTDLKIKPSEIICGHGSDSLIADIIKSFSDHGDEILTSQGSFIGYYVNINKLGRKTVAVPLKNYAYDLGKIIRNITDKTRIIFLANPNNPTGSMFPDKEFKEFMSSVPDDILIVLDEAYSIYAQLHENYPDGLRYNYPNLISMRTFSKSHGLAGVRIGFCIGPEELISTIYKVKLPFEPNTIAQKLAKAAYVDHDFVFQTLKLNTISLERLLNLLDELKVSYVKPHANYVMVLLDDPEKSIKFTDICYEKGILVRQLSRFGIDTGVRISTGTHTQMDYALDIFRNAFNVINNGQ